MSGLGFALVARDLDGVPLVADRAAAQQITAATPYRGASDSFFERTGAHWGLQGKGWSFSFGGVPTSPIAGSPAPGGGIQGGFRFGQPGLGGSFGFIAEQGAQRSLVGHSPGLTTLNGMPGVGLGRVVQSVRDGRVSGGRRFSGVHCSWPRPAIAPGRCTRRRIRLSRVSELPAQDPGRIAPPRRRDGRRSGAGGRSRGGGVRSEGPDRANGAERGRGAAIVGRGTGRRRPGRPKWFDRGVEAERSGNLGAARVCYQMASRRLTGDLKDRALARLASLK